MLDAGVFGRCGIVLRCLDKLENDFEFELELGTELWRRRRFGVMK
jgi:hypothetical protein